MTSYTDIKIRTLMSPNKRLVLNFKPLCKIGKYVFNQQPN